jgi:hypothetical protein
MNSLPFKDDMENMQDMDILDMNVLDEAENDNGVPGEDEYDTDEVLNEDEHDIGISGSTGPMGKAKPEEVRHMRKSCVEQSCLMMLPILSFLFEMLHHAGV